MAKKILLTLFVVVLFVSCTKKTNDSYLKWNPIVVSGDAKIQEYIIDTICMAVAAEKNLPLDGERRIRLKDTSFKQGTHDMFWFDVDVRKKIKKSDLFESVQDAQNDSIGYTMELEIKCIQEVTKNGQTIEGKPEWVYRHYWKYKK